MNSSAGQAFSPHVITIGVGEVVIFFHFISDIGFDALICLVSYSSFFSILNMKMLRVYAQFSFVCNSSTIEPSHCVFVE